MKKRILYIGISLITIALIYLTYVYAFKYHYKIIWDHRKERTEMFSKIKQSFDKNPNAGDAYDLLEYNYGRGEYGKAIFFAKKCLELGAKDEALNGRIHFFIARSHYELNQKDKAKTYLLKAIDLSHPKFAEFKKIVIKYKMDDLLNEKEWKEIACKHEKQDM